MTNSKNIIHIVDASNPYYVEPYVSFIKSEFSFNSTLVDSLTLREVCDVAGKYKKAGIFKNILFLLKNRNKPIIFHSLFIPYRMLFILQFIKLKKSSWVIWGGDLYLKKSRQFKSFLYNLLMNKVKANISFYITQIAQDYDHAVLMHNSKAKHLYGFYPFVFSESYFLSNYKFIQVGNSRDPSNAHIEILTILSKMDVSGKKIFIPIAYGDALDYAEKIHDFARAKFKRDSLFVLDSPLELSEYNEILDDVGVAFFNHKRQQAVGNILLLISKGATVYIRGDITTWCFLKEHELVARDIGQFKQDKKINYLTQEEREYNMKRVRECFSIERGVETWRNVFSAMQPDED